MELEQNGNYVMQRKRKMRKEKCLHISAWFKSCIIKSRARLSALCLPTVRRNSWADNSNWDELFLHVLEKVHWFYSFYTNFCASWWNTSWQCFNLIFRMILDSTNISFKLGERIQQPPSEPSWTTWLPVRRCLGAGGSLKVRSSSFLGLGQEGVWWSETWNTQRWSKHHWGCVSAHPQMFLCTVIV